ncbi:hypothetical protein [Serratia sp. PL7]|uniref:hypothetical protein n=1 Tax=Serratia sp. PL7 TaxID=2952201 RepID=UPI0021ADD53B|nr:hypothetical protein [Serratia sp. PL7]
MHIPANADHGAQPGWWLETKGDDGVSTYEAVVAWQRVDNGSNLAGGALFPVTACGTVCFARFMDGMEIVCIPVERMEWVRGTDYRLKKVKK